jgi:hypothetical protein
VKLTRQVVWGIRIDEVVGPQRHGLERHIGELPGGEHGLIGTEIACVVDGCVAAEGHVEGAFLAIEAAQPVIAGAVEVVEERGRAFIQGAAERR